MRVVVGEETRPPLSQQEVTVSIEQEKMDTAIRTLFRMEMPGVEVLVSRERTSCLTALRLGVPGYRVLEIPEKTYLEGGDELARMLKSTIKSYRDQLVETLGLRAHVEEMIQDGVAAKIEKARAEAHRQGMNEAIESFAKGARRE